MQAVLKILMTKMEMCALHNKHKSIKVERNRNTDRPVPEYFAVRGISGVGDSTKTFALCWHSVQKLNRLVLLLCINQRQNFEQTDIVHHVKKTARFMSCIACNNGAEMLIKIVSDVT